MEPIGNQLQLADQRRYPREDEKGITYQQVKSHFELLNEQYQERRLECGYCLADWIPKGALTTLLVSIVATGIFATVIAIVTEDTALFEWIPLVFAGPWVLSFSTLIIASVINRRLAVIKGREYGKKIDQIQIWIEEREGKPHKIMISPKRLSMFKNDIENFNFKNTEISCRQARSLDLSSDVVPDEFQELLLMVKQVSELKKHEIIEVIKSNGFKEAVFFDPSFFGVYILEVYERGFLDDELIEVLSERVFELFNFEVNDYREVVRCLARGKRLDKAFQIAEKVQTIQITKNTTYEIILFFEGRKIPASRHVLSKSSEYFHSMFNSQFYEANSPLVSIEIDGVETDIYEAIIGYLHHGRLDIDATKYDQYLKVARQQLIHSLKDKIEKQLIRDLPTESARIIEYITWVQEYNLPYLGKSLDKFVGELSFDLIDPELIKSLFTQGDFAKSSMILRHQYLNKFKGKKLINLSNHILNEEFTQAFIIASYKEDKFLEDLSGKFCEVMNAQPPKFRNWFYENQQKMNFALKTLMNKYLDLYKDSIICHWFGDKLTVNDYQLLLHDYICMIKFSGIDRPYVHDMARFLVENRGKQPQFLRHLAADRENWDDEMIPIWREAIHPLTPLFCTHFLNQGISKDSLFELLVLVQEDAAHHLYHPNSYLEPFWSVLKEFILQEVKSTGTSNLLKLLWDTKVLQQNFKTQILAFCKANPILARKVWKVLPKEIDEYK